MSNLTLKYNLLDSSSGKDKNQLGDFVEKIETIKKNQSNSSGLTWRIKQANLTKK